MLKIIFKSILVIDGEIDVIDIVIFLNNLKLYWLIIKMENNKKNLFKV